MKKLFTILFLSFLLFSCDKDEEKNLINTGNVDKIEENENINTGESLVNTGSLLQESTDNEIIKINLVVLNYFEEIKNGNLEIAYNLKYEPTQTLEEFKKIYGDIKDLEIIENKEIGENKYKTIIEIDGEKYESEFEIIDNMKLKTISTKTLNKELDYKIETEEGLKVLYLLKDGNKVKIDSVDGEIKNVEFYKNFLVYDRSSTGGIVKKIFDITTMKEVGGVRFGVWSEDKNIIYDCEKEGYGPGSIQFFNFSNMDNKSLFKDFYEKDIDSSVTFCSFNEEKKEFNFSIKNNSGEKKYIYNIITKKLK